MQLHTKRVRPDPSVLVSPSSALLLNQQQHHHHPVVQQQRQQLHHHQFWVSRMSNSTTNTSSSSSSNDDDDDPGRSSNSMDDEDAFAMDDSQWQYSIHQRCIEVYDESVMVRGNFRGYDTMETGLSGHTVPELYQGLF